MIILDRYMCDWVTLTTKNRKVALDWQAKIFSDADRIQLVETGGKTKRWNYTGTNIPCDGGSIFWGEGVQGKSRRPHWMVQVTGALADKVFFGDLHYLIEPEEHLFNCTRLDLQVTHRDVGFFGNDGHRSINFMKRIDAELKQSDIVTQWKQDVEGMLALATVAVNNRVNEVYFRIYPKRTVNGDALRFEAEFKGTRAQAALDALRVDTSRMLIGKALKQYTHHVPSPLFREFFEEALPAVGVTIKAKKVQRGETNTEFWLMTVVLPAFTRVIRTSPTGDMIARAFMDAMRQAMEDWDV